MKLSKKVKISLIVFIIITSALAVATFFYLQSIDYPEPTGEYKVGTAFAILKDSSRIESIDNVQTARQFKIQCWYPAQPKGDEKIHPQIEQHYIDGMNKLWQLPLGTEEPSFSYLNAPVLKSSKKFPLIIFTHGLGSFATQNNSNMEELASQGYLVLSLTFPYESIAAKLDNGKVVYMQNSDDYLSGMNKLTRDKVFVTEYTKNLNLMKSENVTEAKTAALSLSGLYDTLFPDFKPWLTTRTNDLHYLIQNLSELKVNNTPLEDIGNVNNIGLMGHSFGAITTMKYLMEHPESGIKCGMALDAPYIITSKESPLSISAPVLHLTSEYIELAGTTVQLQRTNYFLSAYTDQPMYEAYVRGTSHMNFTDLNYSPRALRMTPLLGHIEQERAANILQYYCDDFFNTYLKSEEKDFKPKAIFDEVSFEKY